MHMKNLIRYFLLLTAPCMVWSCGEDENMDPVGDWELANPTLTSPAEGTALILDQSQPDAAIQFGWEPAVASNRFLVSYKVYLVPAEAEGIDDPILELTPGNSGRDRTVSVTADQLDYALWARCYPAGAAAQVEWVVQASAIEKSVTVSSPLTVTRFADERMPDALYISGAATEAGANPSDATPMRARTNAEGDPTGVFDVYITLTEGETFHFLDRAAAGAKVFGGSDGAMAGCGTPIAAPETGQYRVTVDFNDNTYTLWKVENWSVVGDAFEGGWGGDVPLAYKGNGIWESKVNFLSPNAGWIFRANGDWAYIMKRIPGTVSPGGLSGKVFMESEASDAGVDVEDLSIDGSGMHTITLDLRADQYSFTIVPEAVEPGDNVALIGKSANPTADQVMGNFDFGMYDTPNQLYLVSNGTMVAEFTKNGNSFTTDFIALEQSKQYILNSASDGSGTTYNEVGDGTIAVDHDQAYQLTVDFETGKLNWKHYNLKVFHWDEDGGGWDQRNEYPMTYVHPYTFSAEGIQLTAGYHIKLNSPWEVQFGTSATALTGTMTNGGDNFTGISQSGVYNVSIEVNDDFSSGEYEFVKQ